MTKDIEDEFLKTVNISAAHCPNLKSALRYLVQQATGQDTGRDDDAAASSKVGHFCQQLRWMLILFKGIRILDYDLEILHGFVKKQGVTKVAICFRNSESFDSTALTQLIDTLGSESLLQQMVFS